MQIGVFFSLATGLPAVLLYNKYAKKGGMTICHTTPYNIK